jgi:hypothetical protein
MSEGYATKGGFTTGFIQRSRTLGPGTGSSTSSRAKRRQGEHPVQMISPSARASSMTIAETGWARAMRPRSAGSGETTCRAALSGRKHDSGSAVRVPASEIEIRVANVVGARSARATTARQAAAVKLMRKLLKKQGFAPDLLVSDRLRSYASAMSKMGLSARYEQGLRRSWLRIRISRRDGERKMQRFKSRSFCHPRSRLQPFQVQRHLTSAKSHRGLRAVAMSTWRRKRQSAFRQQILDGSLPGSFTKQYVSGSASACWYPA